jgi:hypothetical protein
MTITGSRTTNQIISTEGFLSKRLHGMEDYFGNRIGKGVYIYKLTVNQLTKSEKFEKTCDTLIKHYIFNEFYKKMRKLILLQAAYSVFLLQMLKTE